ncbi:phage baseplate assembly protein V [Burkholderia sp. Nafp2/4-1b]|uniref:phage baseplate assembly protein V n=1 Tax=Burkholderia sp. Nafp2/4-1b TaxID=2116686 RepID=UPI000EF8EBBF|nr:phage baseplate assembly protein V [Burkholderia sp. Nafp2/4-1b]RKU01959.1 phage baseplate assembly protein V [Burkholderia sp. Nafp2/4-1b]
MDTNDMQRQARNVVRKGAILAVDHAASRCRVTVGATDDDGLQTDWIPWLVPAAGTTREWLPPTEGEQVVLLAPMGDLAQAVVLRGLYSDAAPAPDRAATTHTRVYADGARLRYDHDAHALTAELPAGGTVRIVSPGSITIDTQHATIQAQMVTLDADETICTGALQVKGALTFESGMTGKHAEGGSHAVLMIHGSAALTGDVVADGVSLIEHAHEAHGEFARTSAPIGGNV